MSEENGVRKRREKVKRICAYPPCGAEFLTRRISQRYHSEKCRYADYAETHERIPLSEYAEFLKWKQSAKQTA